MTAPAPRDRTGEGGFAMVTALAAALLFSLLAYTVLAADRGALADVSAQIERARLQAAADAALATTVEGLGAKGKRRWPLDGRSRTLTFDNADATVTVEDERGKVALNRITQNQARRLFQAAGLAGSKLDQLTDNLLDWEDGAERPNGARVIDYAQNGVRERGGPIRTLGELMAIKGMDLRTYDRITPSLTLFFGGRATFDLNTATPLAVAAMEDGGAQGPDTILQARKQAGQRAAFDTDTPAEADYAGRPLSVLVTVRDAHGGLFRRTTIVEFTGQPARPVWVRAIN